MVDGVAEGEVLLERGAKEPFHQLDDGFAWVRSHGRHTGHPIAGSRRIPLILRGAMRSKKWQHRRIIPVTRENLVLQKVSQ